MKALWHIVIAVLANCLPHFSACAEIVNVTVTDQSGKPVNNAIVSAYSQSKQKLPLSNPEKTIIVDQINKEFVQHVTPIQVGTAINFPNHDQIRHHVYSLSPAKNFEIPLYKGIPVEPIAFEQEGVVVLGCNIHDKMSAYIVVIDSPFFAKTEDQGRASLTLPTGEYELHFWHRDADEQRKNSKQLIKMTAGQAGNISVELNLKPSWSSERASLLIQNRGRYR
jgi:plastocyanin